MTSRPLRLEGAWQLDATVHRDERGHFFEAFSVTHLHDLTGVQFDVAQVNVSTSVRGTIRGLHYSDVPPGQAKYVQCLDGEILDVMVDLRVGSATFGHYEAIRLDSSNRQALLIPIGFGHAFQAISGEATVLYCCNTPYAPGREHAIHPLDAHLRLPWDPIEPLLSPKDAAAPSWDDVVALGSLPTTAACRDVESEWRA